MGPWWLQEVEALGEPLETKLVLRNGDGRWRWEFSQGLLLA